MGIDRISGSGRVGRDSGSAGFGALDRKSAAEDTAPERDPRVNDVAKMYEKQFLREMVKAMRGTVSFGAEKPSMAENIFREQLDEQYVESWGDQGGVGLSDLIYNQIMERFFSSSAGKELKAQGAGADGQKPAIPLTDRSIARVSQMKSSAPGAQIPLRIELNGGASGSSSSAATAQPQSARLQAPWAGEILSNTRLEGGKTALTISHGPNLKSTLVFEGVAGANVQPGAKVERGSQLAILSPEIHSFLWNLNQMSQIGERRVMAADAIDSGRGL